MCPHEPACPPADAAGREAARLIAFHPGQGWGLLCNGVVVFDDDGGLLPDGRAVPSSSHTAAPDGPARCPAARAAGRAA